MFRSSLARYVACTTLLFTFACSSSSKQKEALVSVSVVATADATCPNGGTLLQSGVDTNENGVLDPSEVTSTQELCKPAPGELVITDTMVGSNCPDGGTRIQSGVDTNGNGTLDPGEVTQTQYVCNQLPTASYYVGSVSITSQADLTALQSYSIVIGDVSVTPSFSGALSWPMLTEITGGLEIDGAPGSGTVDVQLTKLAKAEYVEIDSHPGITTLALDALTSASSIEIDDLPNATSVSFAKANCSYLDIEGNSLLTSISMPALTSLQELYFTGNAAVTSLSLPTTAPMVSINVQNNAALTSFALDKITALGSAYFQSNNALTTLSFQALTTITEEFQSYDNAIASVSLPALTTIAAPDGALIVDGANALTSLSFPALTTANRVDFESNSALTTLSLPVLTKASTLIVANDPSLPTCSVVDTIVKVFANGGLNSWSWDNDDTTTACTPAEYCTTQTFTGVTGTYHFCLNSTDWSDAQTACAATYTGGNLATFDSAADWTTFRTAVSTDMLTAGTAWIGYNDLAVQDTWVGPTGVTAGFNPLTTDATFWNPGEPNDSGGAEHCAQLVSPTGYVNDENCVNGFIFICRD
jgi:hypothetical protein